MKELETEQEPTHEHEAEDGARMSFLEHLEDLRKRLIHIVYYVLAAFVLCWIFNEKIFWLINRPITKVLDNIAKNATKTRLMEVTIKDTGQSPLLTELIRQTQGKLQLLVVDRPTIITTEVTEAFTLTMYVCLVAALFLVSP